ncbi:MAG: metal-dependent hydrolase [Pseudomonadales bacterium]|nr:metal-dependent hydrolase [Pseudomonadales bacterium]
MSSEQYPPQPEAPQQAAIPQASETTEIIVRRVNFDFPPQTSLYAIPKLPRLSLYIAAFSLTMPYLEPYLIRMMLKARNTISDEQLLADMKQFSQQEGNHFRNHARINKIIRSKFDKKTSAELLQIENELKAEYESFLAQKPLAFNLAYAEGFEAMTCAAAMGSANRNVSKGLSSGWDKLIEWHSLEEIEHRTVAYDVYQKLVGSYFYRLKQGLSAQIHYLKYVHKFYAVMLKAQGRRVVPYISMFILGGGYRYLNTLMPWYNPANYKITAAIKRRKEKYSSFAPDHESP